MVGCKKARAADDAGKWKAPVPKDPAFAPGRQSKLLLAAYAAHPRESPSARQTGARAISRVDQRRRRRIERLLKRSELHELCELERMTASAIESGVFVTD